MKLLRLATLYFDPAPKEVWRSWRMQYGPVAVVTRGAYDVDGKLRLLVVAEVEIGLPAVTEEGLLAVPERPRRAAEVAIETAANLIAVCERCGRSVSSPTPCVALLPQDRESRRWLQAQKGFGLAGTVLPQVTPGIGHEAAQRLLAGRSDGAALLAEALSCHHATSRFREFLRLFERAFRCSSSRLVGPLTSFLAGSDRGYTEKEVTHWVVSLRHRATHADTRDDFVLESDVRSVLARMEDAAYDVLLNKEQWRSRGDARRDGWSPPAATTADGLRVRQGAYGFALRTQLLDPFGSFPIDLSAFLQSPPEEWWVGDVAAGTPGFPIDVQPRPGSETAGGI